MLRKIILASSVRDSLIVDPFGGSGTTYAVAEAYDRKWLGSELSSEYCELIKSRVEDKELLKRINTAKDEVDSDKRRAALRG